MTTSWVWFCQHEAVRKSNELARLSCVGEKIRLLPEGKTRMYYLHEFHSCSQPACRFTALLPKRIARQPVSYELTMNFVVVVVVVVVFVGGGGGGLGGGFC